jgi:hypothetical protein
MSTTEKGSRPKNSPLPQNTEFLIHAFIKKYKVVKYKLVRTLGCDHVLVSTSADFAVAHSMHSSTAIPENTSTRMIA